VDVLLDLDNANHLSGQQVITAPLAAAISPLGKTHDRIRLTGLGQDQVFQGWRDIPFQVMGVVGHQETNEQIAKARRFFAVSEDVLDEPPERLRQVEFFNLVPTWRGIPQVDLVFICPFSKGVEQGADHGEEFRLVGPDDNSEHLPIQVVCGVVGGHEGL
jgi:hypothetical protein